MNIIVTEKLISEYNINTIPKNIMLQSKMYGCSDKQIARILNENNNKNDDKISENDVRKIRIKKYNIGPYIKQIDTLAAEFPGMTWVYF